MTDEKKGDKDQGMANALDTLADFFDPNEATITDMWNSCVSAKWPKSLVVLIKIYGAYSFCDYEVVDWGDEWVTEDVAVALLERHGDRYDLTKLFGVGDEGEVLEVAQKRGWSRLLQCEEIKEALEQKETEDAERLARAQKKLKFSKRTQ